MTPHDIYQSAIKEGLLLPDKAQENAVSRLDELYHRFNQVRHNTSFKNLLKRRQTCPGLYIWGGTGRGKTYLMDAFYSCLDIPRKNRLHFHRFMRDIHSQIRDLAHHQDPLKIIAKRWSSEYQLLCLDEFHVTDITDAMILARLLDNLFTNGVVLVTTSNIAIDELYKDGLQRDSFLPAIKLLHQYTLDVPLGEGTDYRLSYLEHANNYYIARNNEQCPELPTHFERLADVKPKHNREIIINDRPIRYIAWANDIIWFDFNELCATARSAIDYMEIAQCFQTIFISNIRHMNDDQNDIARRFIHLIDALYDHRVKVFASAESMPDALYDGKNMAFAFSRAVSRLSEMSTIHYLGEAHH